MKSIMLACVLLLAVGCGKMESSGSAQRVPVNVQAIFTANCAKSGCHAGSSPQQEQNLSEEFAYANIVGVASHEMPSLKRVDPGNPDNSYLVLKIEGVGIVGDRMPFDQLGSGPNGYLTQAEIDTIRAWIQDGAPAR